MILTKNKKRTMLLSAVALAVFLTACNQPNASNSAPSEVQSLPASGATEFITKDDAPAAFKSVINESQKASSKALSNSGKKANNSRAASYGDLGFDFGDLGLGGDIDLDNLPTSVPGFGTPAIPTISEKFTTEVVAKASAFVSALVTTGEAEANIDYAEASINVCDGFSIANASVKANAKVKGEKILDFLPVMIPSKITATANVDSKAEVSINPEKILGTSSVKGIVESSSVSAKVNDVSVDISEITELISIIMNGSSEKNPFDDTEISAKGGYDASASFSYAASINNNGKGGKLFVSGTVSSKANVEAIIDLINSGATEEELAAKAKELASVDVKVAGYNDNNEALFSYDITEIVDLAEFAGIDL